MAASRFIFHAHDGSGLGAVHRNLAIAAALTREDPDATVLLVTGCIELGALRLPPNVDIVAIPRVRSRGNGLNGARPLPESELRSMRTAAMGAIVESFRPHVLLIDKHPIGVGGELRQALDSLMRCKGRAVLGVRDILGNPAAVRREWARGDVAGFAEEHCERLLVYGNADTFDFAREYGLPRSLAPRIRYCGYVVNREPRAEGGIAARLPPSPRVLACAGGGEDGRALLETFVVATRSAPWNAVVVAGPQSSPTDRGALRRLSSEAGVEFHASVPELFGWMADVDALVCTGGYNTLVEALSHGTPTLCVPRVRPRAEELIRARMLARLGLLRVVEPWRSSPELLRSEVAALLGADRREIAARAHAVVGFDGASLAAQALLELVRSPRPLLNSG
jgi:predicted glycosyltransferase